MKYAADPARMIGGRHDHHRAVLMSIAPVEQDRRFVFGAGDPRRYLLDHRHAKQSELPRRMRRLLFITQAASYQLEIRGFDDLCEDADGSCDAGVNEIGGFEHARGVDVDGQNDGVGALDRVTRDERAAGRLKDWGSKARYERDRRDEQESDRCWNAQRSEIQPAWRHALDMAVTMRS